MLFTQDGCSEEYFSLRQSGFTSDDAADKVTTQILNELEYYATPDSTYEDDLISLRNWWMDLDLEEIEG